MELVMICNTSADKLITKSATESLYHERKRLFDIVGEDKGHPQYTEYLDVCRRFLSALNTPQVSKELQMKAVMSFNADTRFSITE